MSLPEQLSFELPALQVMGWNDFYVSPANALAVATVESPAWPGGRLALSGPPGSGKTHLAHAFAEDSGASMLSARDLAGGLDDADMARLASASVAIDGADELAGDGNAERAALHLFNLALSNGHRVLLTGRQNPTRWPIALPDLKSRAMGAHHVALGQPDDALLAAVLAKLFADRQIVPRADVIPFLVSNMPRSFSDAQGIVAALDRAALSQRRDLTRPLAARLLRESAARRESRAA